MDEVKCRDNFHHPPLPTPLFHVSINANLLARCAISFPRDSLFPFRSYIATEDIEERMDRVELQQLLLETKNGNHEQENEIR